VEQKSTLVLPVLAVISFVFIINGITIAIHFCMATNLRHIMFQGDPGVIAFRRRSASLRRRERSPVLNQRQPYQSQSLSLKSQPMNDFCRWLLIQAGLDPTAYREGPMRRRTSACLRALGADSPQEGKRLLERRPELLSAALRALLIGVTEFYRDPQVFDVLRRRLIPELAKSGRGLRVWSAACSSGQELYTMAFLLDEVGLLEGSDMLGSDCRRDAIAQADRGIYSSQSARLLPEGLKSYLKDNADDLTVTVDDRVRRKVRWRQSDLLTEPEQGPWDLILWRNHAIYLEAYSATMVWRSLVPLLKPGGMLVVGNSERPADKLDLEMVSRSIYRRSTGL
jgi:chemotaxis protein methyltransferase CheR